MDKANLPHGWKVYAPLLVLFAILVLLMPRSGKFNYDYRKGAPWMYETLVAQFDFPVLKTSEQLQAEKEQASSAVIPYYRYSDNIVNETLAAVRAAGLGKYDSLRSGIVRIISDIYAKGIIETGSGDLPDISEKDNDVIFIQREKRAVQVPASEVFTVTSAKERLARGTSGLQPGCNGDSLCLYSGIYDLLIPNLIFDRQTTDLVHEESVNFISPTSGVVNSGQLIVSKGEMITSEIEQLLDSYKAEYESSFGYTGPRVFLWMGNALIALALVVILFLSLYYTYWRVFASFNKYIYVLVIFLISFILAIFVEKADPAFLYLTPFVLIALYLQAFFKKRVVLPVYIISLLPLLVFSHNGLELFLMNLVAGVVAIYVFIYFNKGWQQFVTALCVFLVLMVVYLGFRLIDGIKGFDDFRTIFFMFLGSFLIVAGYPLIYLFERMFMLVSSSRLIELCDTNSKPLLELAHKAPGTFQHCLQVMNMADAAAKSIGADVPLVRAGALYHDIGKTLNPQCFIENDSTGTNYHQGLTPLESAKEIIKHVPDGLSLADKYGLPDEIKQFIVTHHGTTCTAYFYNKYINAGGDPDKADDFYYKGSKPKTPEQVILMLCDTLEAASRTLKDYTPKSISSLVEGVVRSKMEAGQFEDADITLRELNTIKSVMKDYIQQIHHARVVYPKRNPPVKGS